MSRPPGNKCSRCQKPWHGPRCTAPYAPKRTRPRAGRIVGAVTEAHLEKLGRLVDTVDNLVHAGAIPMPDKLRVTALTEALPTLHSDLKALYVEISGDDPWADI